MNPSYPLLCLETLQHHLSHSTGNWCLLLKFCFHWLVWLEISQFSFLRGPALEFTHCSLLFFCFTDFYSDLYYLLFLFLFNFIYSSFFKFRKVKNEITDLWPYFFSKFRCSVLTVSFQVLLLWYPTNTDMLCFSIINESNISYCLLWFLCGVMSYSEMCC